jgi:peptidoglycan/xylan/chitin deacetylase (PgdA/CDA1 family)
MLKGTRNSLTVFTFHRLVREVDPLFPEYRTVAQFSSIVKTLKAHFELMTLDRGLEKVNSNVASRPIGVITFDDGYLDNFELALPVLQSHGVMASFYVSTTHLEGNAMFSDLVAEAFRHFSGVADLSDLGLGIRTIVSNQDRIAAHISISEIIKYLPREIRDDRAWTIFRQLAPTSNVSQSMMSGDHLKSMAKAGMEIGSHTHGHIILSKEAPETARLDLIKSKEILENLLQKDARGFAYPNGKALLDFDADAKQLVERCGFSYAVTTDPQLYVRTPDRYQIPRVSLWKTTPVELHAFFIRYRVAQFLSSSER